MTVNPTQALQALEQQSELYRFMSSEKGVELSLMWNAMAPATIYRGGATENVRDEELSRAHVAGAQQMLRRATPFYWEPNCTELVKAAAQKLPEHTYLSRRDLVVDCGFFFFPKPYSTIEIPEPRRLPVERVSSHAISWMVLDDRLIVAMYEKMVVNESGERWETPLMPLRFSVHKFDEIALSAQRRIYIDDSSVEPALATAMADRVRTEWAAMLFVGQKLVAVEDRSVPRGARRRNDALVRRDFRIIRLRENHRGARGEGISFIEWSCRWAVRGHWRNQYYPSVGGNRTIWIDPYVKGPEDKPFRVTTTVFDVAR